MFEENNQVQGVSLEIPEWRFKEFCKIRKEHNDGRRWGQQFFDYMELEKITSPINRAWSEKLYQVDDRLAIAMVRERLSENVF